MGFLLNVELLPKDMEEYLFIQLEHINRQKNGVCYRLCLQEPEGHALPAVAVTVLSRNCMRAQKICSLQILCPIGTCNLMTEFSTRSHL